MSYPREPGYYWLYRPKAKICIVVYVYRSLGGDFCFIHAGCNDAIGVRSYHASRWGERVPDEWDECTAIPFAEVTQ